MNKFIKIKDNLFLSQQSIKKDINEVVEVVDIPTNYIFICDTSGSMYYEMASLRSQVKEKVRSLKKGDTFSLARFSGKKDCEFIVEGFRINEEDYKNLDTLIDKKLTSTGLTCFSEILFDAKRVIGNLKLICGDRFALFFLTDGYPTDGSISVEEGSIMKAIEELNGEITSSVIVGYSDYYNKQLLTKMAEQLGSILIHSEDMPSFSIIFDNFIKSQIDTDGRIEVALDNESDLGVVFGINGENVTLYSPRENGSILFSPTKLKEDYAYTLTSSKPNGEEVLDVDKSEQLIKALYASARIFSQKTNTSMALDILGFIGDVFFINRINNSFTNKEYGDVENQIMKAMISPSDRFMAGKNTNYLPKEDGFCLINAIDILLGDENAFFYPRHECFKYKSKGVPSKPVDGFPKFIANDDVRCSLNKLTWNNSRPNLSVLAVINGFIEFNDDDHNKFGIAKKFPTHIYRNYLLVADGNLNTNKLPVSLSKESFDILKGHGMFNIEDIWEDGKILILNLDSVPIMNRAMAKNNTSAESLCRSYLEQKRLEGHQKVYKYYLDEFEKTDEVLDSIKVLFGDEGSEYLSKNGIGKNGFSPKVEKCEATDFYISKEFEIKASGFSNLPKVSDVEVKIDKKTSMNPSFEIMSEAILEYRNSGAINFEDGDRKSWLEDKLKDVKDRLNSTRKKIQETKFAILLGKQWFKEFSSREENSIDVDGTNFSIVVQDKQVAY